MYLLEEHLGNRHIFNVLIQIFNPIPEEHGALVFVPGTAT